MLHRDRCALICDLAEVYHIYDYRSLPASRAATFAVGLRNDSRIKSIMRGEDLNGNERSEVILANINDLLFALLRGGKDFPSMIEAIMGKPEHKKQEDSDLIVFDSAEDFDAAWKRIIGG